MKNIGSKGERKVKKHLSVFMLMARNTIYKILGLFVLMAAVEGSLVYSRLKQGDTGDSFNLELVISESHILWVFGIGFVLITIMLSMTGCEFSSKLGYILKRLSISERWIFFWQSIYNTICYLLFWMVQILIVFGLCNLYVKMAPEGYVTNQTVFLAFYRSDFLHSLMPMEDIAYWVRNMIIVVALGICSAHYPMVQRRGSKLWEIIPLAGSVIVFFVGELGEMYSFVMTIACSVCAVGAAIFHIFIFEEEGEKLEKMEVH